MVSKLEISIIVCNCKLNSIQFYQLLHSAYLNFAWHWIQSRIPICNKMAMTLSWPYLVQTRGLHFSKNAHCTLYILYVRGMQRLAFTATFKALNLFL